MATGIIPIDKPQGWTSQDVAARLRRVFQTRRIGHGGTLDPMATGVLPIFVGRATRAVEFFESAQKEYIATLRLGLLTDTQDVTGRILETRPADVSPEALEAVLARFLGPQMQVPPMYSALKVNGQKLYELARQGKAVERQPRPITIYELELLEFRNGDCRLRVQCGHRQSPGLRRLHGGPAAKPGRGLHPGPGPPPPAPAGPGPGRGGRLLPTAPCGLHV